MVANKIILASALTVSAFGSRSTRKCTENDAGASDLLLVDSKPKKLPGSMFSHLHNLPKVATSGILPLSTLRSVAALIPTSAATSRIFLSPRAFLTIPPKLLRVLAGIIGPPKIVDSFCETKLDVRNQVPVVLPRLIISGKQKYTNETIL
jgi:hypothetical protein